MIPEFRDLSYESCLLQCGLTILETRRLRGDQIEVFKIVNCYEDVDRNMFFKLKEGSRTRGHKAALVKEQCRLDMRKYSFSHRVINEWNKLPNECVNASRVYNFTKHVAFVPLSPSDKRTPATRRVSRRSGRCIAKCYSYEIIRIPFRKNSAIPKPQGITII